jgi:PKD repeat protein
MRVFQKTGIAHVLVLIMTATLFGCNGGGGGSPSNAKPTASFIVTPDNGYAPLQVQLDASASSDPDGQIVEYRWDLGNGGTATGRQATLVYSDPNQYTISLTVVDNDGATSQTAATKTINVLKNSAPLGTIDQPTFNPTINVGDSITFQGSAADADGHLPLSFVWDFGDGSGIAPIMQEDAGPVRFNTPGSFTVTFTPTDAMGASDSDPATVVVTVQASNPLSRTGWTASTDSEELGGGPTEGPVAYILDGNAATMWHTEYEGANAGHPHFIEVDMGGLRDIHGFTVLPRQDSDVNGRIIDYAFYACETSAFSNPATVVGSFRDEPDLQQVVFPRVRARYVRLVAFSESKGSPWSTMAEFNVLGEFVGGNLPPEGTIDTPAQDVVITVGDTVTFAGSASDPDNTLPLAGYWNFGTDSGVANSQLEDPGAVQFDTAGTYVVRYTVIDNSGQWDPTPATRIVKVLDSGDSAVLSQADWSLLYTDSEEDTTFSGFATNAFDGDSGTFWLTQYTPDTGDPGQPHEIQIDLGSAFQVDGLRYLPRQGDSVGRIKSYEVYVSPDGVNWNPSVGFGDFVDDTTEKQLQFAPVYGQFVRLVSREEVSSGKYTSAAEINVMGRCSDAYVHMIYPLDLTLHETSSLTASAAVCLGPLYSNYAVKFSVDGGLQEATVTGPPWETTFTGMTAAEHTVEAVIVDGQGLEVAGTSTSASASSVGIGDYYVAIGDSITVGLGDDYSADDVSDDGRNKEGGYASVLNNLLTQARGYPHTVVMEAVSGHTTVDALTYVPTVLPKHPNAEFYLLLYGTNDSSISTDLTKAEFKANMQALITMIRNAGKEAYLAKVPYAKNQTPARLARIGEYNAAIDELVSENSIAVTPPDFYTYFEANQDEMSPTDNLHMNGTGYQSMALLWKDAIAP